MPTHAHHAGPDEPIAELREFCARLKQLHLEADGPGVESFARRPDAPLRKSAIEHHRRALELAREIHGPLEEARALEGIGRCLLHQGARESGLEHLRDALSVYQKLGVSEATTLGKSLSE